VESLIVPDTSAWVEYLRRTGSRADRRLSRLARSGSGSVMVTEPVLMEVLSGARSRAEWNDLQRLMRAFDFARIEGPGDWVDAAALQRRMRLAGRTVKSAVDCLIATIAMRVDAAVLHMDADFDAIAQHAPLKIA
jgi:predicted nucleic acid-binding protein